jgi:hypothetical protein
MSDKAAAWIDSVIAFGAVLLILLLQDWSGLTRPRIALILAAAFVSSCMKVRVPGITGSYSLSFIVVLIAMSTCTLHEIVLIAALAAVVQTGWRSRVTPTSRHFFFNGSVLLASVTASHSVYEWLITGALAQQHVAALALTAAVYWMVNTGVVSVTLSLLGEGSPAAVWSRWAMWTLPYYIAGTAIAGALSPAAQASWKSALTLIVAAVLGYCCWGVAIEGRGFRPFAGRRHGDGQRRGFTFDQTLR